MLWTGWTDTYFQYVGSSPWPSDILVLWSAGSQYTSWFVAKFWETFRSILWVFACRTCFGHLLRRLDLIKSFGLFTLREEALEGKDRTEVISHGFRHLRSTTYHNYIGNARRRSYPVLHICRESQWMNDCGSGRLLSYFGRAAWIESLHLFRIDLQRSILFAVSRLVNKFLDSPAS